MLTALPLAGLAAAGLVLRGSPPAAATVDDAVDRATAAGDVLTPWGRTPPQAAGGTGVTVTPDGEVVLLHRAGAPFASGQPMTADPIVVLDPGTGEVRRSWGAGLFRSPHGVSAAPNGDLWVTDVMTNKVTVFGRDGTPRRTLGHDYGTGLDTCLAVRNELTNLPCTGDPYIFARPTDVAPGADAAYVADGYRNSRVARFAADGTFAHAWGELGDAAGEFSIPHGIALRPDGVVAVADRRNARVQLFTPDGGHLATHASGQLGRPYDVAFGADGTLLALDGGDALDEDGGRRRGYVVALAGDGTVTRRWALRDQDADPHQLAVGPHGELYVAALTGPPLWRWTP
ncbi:peptidyl-alpha-hydroxyglycine alpha-amidating lyase family protein [Catellatospora bangladeshensis]|uniref:peptidyl-alpha-hydroxyglycine alpha-amidating lyase family protein n=1 Tax=Catellatospora bangladeshensis TaxID=310355 RepID=UPI001EF34C47|nr:peptidyl-alpha-hydroxyglycine alpha-amidating lyase family protein [Catellatospora bangladeshensis]